MGRELIQHGKLGSGYIHKITNWRFQTTVSRNDVLNQFTALDVDKSCFDIETGKYYLLKSVHPTSGVPTWYEIAENLGAGEANTISSVGGGTSLVKGKVGVDLRVKSIINGPNITFTVDADTVTINAVVPTLDGSTISRIANSALAAYRVVYEANDTDVAYVDPTNYVKTRPYVGITTASALAGAAVQLKTSGVIINPSWAWTPGIEVWVAANGLLTQIEPASGYKLSAGMALTATSINLQLELLQTVGGGGGGGTVTAGTSTVPMGPVETNEGSLVVTGQMGITGTSKVMASIGNTATVDYTSADHRYLGALGVSVTVGDYVVGTGFTIFIRSVHKLSGDISIDWIY